VRFRAFVILGVLAFVVIGGVAAADHNGHEFASAQECMSSGTAFDRVPSCRRSNQGPWIAQYGPTPGEATNGAFGAFLGLALLWAAAPAVIGGVIASNRGQSVGLAVLICIILGWIGLLIVVLTFKPEVVTAARNVIDTAARQSPPPLPGPPATRRDTAARLEELDRLKRENVITAEEHAARRQAILAEI